MKKHALLLLVVGLLLSACGPEGTAVPKAEAFGPQAWFDAPLPGSMFPPSPVHVVSHFSDPGGIAEIELSVNGAVIDTFPSSDPGNPLVTDTRSWTPEGPGEYVLRARAKNHQGEWSDYAETYVIVDALLEEATGGVVQGVVYADLDGSGAVDSGEGPLDGAEMQLSGCGPSASQTTAADGQFSFTGLPAGSCLLEASKPGWAFSGSVPDLGYPIPVASDPNLPTALSVLLAPVAQSTPTATPARFIPTSTPFVPTPTPTQAPPDTQFPVVTSANYSPGAPTTDDFINFSATASDNVGVARIEIYFTPSGGSGQLVKTCNYLPPKPAPNPCTFQGGPYSSGLYIYLVKAFDGAGNQGSSWPQNVSVSVVVK